MSRKNNIFRSKMILNVFLPVIMPGLLWIILILAHKGQKSVIFQWFHKIAWNMVYFGDFWQKHQPEGL